MKYFWANYLSTNAEGYDPDASPLLAENLSGLPPATIVGAQIDPLQTEGQQYAAAVSASGVPVRYKLYEGVTHEVLRRGRGDPRRQRRRGVRRAGPEDELLDG